MRKKEKQMEIDHMEEQIEDKLLDIGELSSEIKTKNEEIEEVKKQI
jgi:hypothetical protein